MAGHFEKGDEISGLIKGGNFLDWLSNY